MLVVGAESETKKYWRDRTSSSRQFLATYFFPLLVDHTLGKSHLRIGGVVVHDIPITVDFCLKKGFFVGSHIAITMAAPYLTKLSRSSHIAFILLPPQGSQRNQNPCELPFCMLCRSLGQPRCMSPIQRLVGPVSFFNVTSC